MKTQKILIKLLCFELHIVLYLYSTLCFSYSSSEIISQELSEFSDLSNAFAKAVIRSLFFYNVNFVFLYYILFVFFNILFDG